MNRLIIFDLDGVLFESREMHYETLNGALMHYGHKPITHEDHVARFNGLPTRVKLDMLDIAGEDAERVKREKQARTLGWVYKNVKRDEDLVALFTDLRTVGWKLAVASNAITVTVVRSLQLLGLWGLCDVCIAGDRVLCTKPDPEIYYWCMRECEAEPDSTYIVEDSPVGLEGARATGARVVAVTGPSDVVTTVRALMEEAS